MKPIKRVVLKDAKLLSTDEMKHLFEGNGNLTISQLINKTCKVNTACTVVYTSGSSGFAAKTGTCQGSYSNGSVTCFCEVGGVATSSTNLSHCFRGN